MALSELFAGVKVYENKWTPVGEPVKIPEEDIKQITEAVVVDGDYSPAAKLVFNGGEACLFIVMDTKDSWSKVGETLDLHKCSIRILKKVVNGVTKYMKTFIG